MQEVLTVVVDSSQIKTDQVGRYEQKRNSMLQMLKQKDYWPEGIRPP